MALRLKLSKDLDKKKQVLKLRWWYYKKYKYNIKK
jgi:hypothetical protein